MGYKHQPFAPSCLCWTEPGHIFMKDFDGTIRTFNSTIKVQTSKQCNDFESDTAKWVLRSGNSVFVGNCYGTYSEMDIATRELLTCGSWEQPPNTFVPCGVFAGDYCYLDSANRKLVILPGYKRVFMLNHPLLEYNLDLASGFAEDGDGGIYIYTGGRLLDSDEEGTWISAPDTEGAYNLCRI